jgi:hypothetical protein
MERCATFTFFATTFLKQRNRIRSAIHLSNSMKTLMTVASALLLSYANPEHVNVDPHKVLSKDTGKRCFNNADNASLREPSLVNVRGTFMADSRHWKITLPLELCLQGHAKPKALFDSVTDTLILLYNYFANSTNEKRNFGTFQIQRFVEILD